MSFTPSNRRRSVRAPLWFVLAVLAALPVLAGSLVPFSQKDTGDDPLVFPAIRSSFVYEISAKGELESAGTTDVLCQVGAPRDPWITILDVVPEGTYVEPGDFLVRLDSTQWEDQRAQQLINVERSKAELTTAEREYDVALAAKKEYLEGQFVLAKHEAEISVFVASNRADRAARYFEASQKLQNRGFLTDKQLEADRFALQKARTDLSAAEGKLQVLETLTRQKELETLNANIAIAKSQLETAQYRHRRRLKRLQEYEDNIAKCTIRAPVAGRVVLAHLYHYGHAHMIAPGEQTQQNRVLVRLPDPKRMQVVVRIPEAEIATVAPGMPVSIALEAYPHVALQGHLLKINAFPEEPDWFDPSLLFYKAVVSIETPFDGLRPGMSADVQVCVDRSDKELQVPLQSLVANRDHTYCVTFRQGQPVAREVVLGRANGQMAVIVSGLEEGDRVALRPSLYRKVLGLSDRPGPELNGPQPDKTAEENAPAATARRSAASHADRSAA